MKISLVISTYNRPDVLAKSLEGVTLQRRPPDEVLIADDGSGQPTRDLVQSWSKSLTFPVKHIWHEDHGFRKTSILNQKHPGGRRRLPGFH